MTRLVTCGWEAGETAELGGADVIAGSGTVTVVTGTPTPASHTYCLKCQASSGTSDTAGRSVTIAGSPTEVWLRVRLFPVFVGGNNTVFLRFVDTAATNMLNLAVSATDGLIRAYRVTTAVGSGAVAAGSVVGTSSAAATGSAWNLIQVHYKADQTTGTVEVWLNGAQVMNVTTGDSTAGLTTIASAVLTHTSTGVNVSTGYRGFDDLAVNNLSGTVNNGRPADMRIAWLPPSGAEASSGWTPSAGSNYACVDDSGVLSAGTADYVAAASAALVDDYAVTDLLGGAASVAVVVAVAYATNPDGGVSQVKVGVISGATTSAGTAQSPGATYGYVREQFETDPATSAAWTVAGVNACKVRIESA